MVRYKEITVGFYKYLGRFYFALICGGKPFSYDVIGGEIGYEAKVGPDGDEKVEMIPKEDWKKYGLTKEMVSRRFPTLSFDGE